MQSAMRHGGATWVLRLLTLLFACALWPAAAATPAEQALAVYEQGKRLYDAGDYAGARSRFIEAAKIEPANPRWQYNLGLAHRQLGNDHAARQALLKARELDPDYKRAEIDQKLASMGFGTDGAQAAPAPPDGGDDAAFVLWMVGGVFAVVLSFIGLVFWLVSRKSTATAPRKPRPTSPAPDPEALADLRHRVDAIAPQLVRVEHALRLGEHADLRSQLDHATRLENTARTLLAEAEAGDGHAFRKAGRTVGELEASAGRAAQIAQDAFGAPAFAGTGDPLGCWFCARPLANPAFRRPVAMKRGEARAALVACPDCAAAAAQGRAPAVLAADGGRRHWSEVPGFDPYAARHGAAGELERVPGWRFAPQRPLSELALLATGGAVAGGALAALLQPDSAQAATPLLDLDAARESGLAQEAARAAAERASEQRRERLSDHS